MSSEQLFESLVKLRRMAIGWSQDELARRAGLSRAGVSAIETGRLVPSTAAALSLAAAFDCRVEDLFRLRSETVTHSWAWPSPASGHRYWAAEMGGAVRLYPVEATAMGTIAHDGIWTDEAPNQPLDLELARRSLVMAGCDPAVGVLAAALGAMGIRLIPLNRSSRAGLKLLSQGLVHVAGIHLGRADDPDGNTQIARGELGPGYTLLRAARWEEGIAHAASHRFRSIRDVVKPEVRWVGREAGSAARECFDEITQGRGRKPAVEHEAANHRGVAEAVRSGWAEAGICLRLVTEEAGLAFLSIREEAHDFCFPTTLAGDFRIKALVEIVQSAEFRKTVGELPGYASRETGESWLIR